MEDVYVKSKTKYQPQDAATAEGPQEMSSLTIAANEPNASFKKRFNSLLFEDPQLSFASFSSDSSKVVGVAKVASRECETPFPTKETSWMDDFRIGEELYTACHSIDPRQNSHHMGCLSELFYPAILSPNDLRPGLFQDMYNRAMY